MVSFCLALCLEKGKKKVRHFLNFLKTTAIAFTCTRVQLYIEPVQIINIRNRKKKASNAQFHVLNLMVTNLLTRSRIRLLCQEAYLDLAILFH